MAIVYIDMDDVLCDFTGTFKRMVEQTPKIGFPQSQYGFFAGLPVLEGAVEAALDLLQDDRFDPYILTAPSEKNPLCYTEKRNWVEMHLGLEYVKRLIISPNKSLLKGGFLIDDHASGKGQEYFEGELLLFGSDEFPTWKEVRARLGF